MTLPSVSQDIATLLEGGGLGLVQAADLFIMEWGPDSTDEQILIMDTAGFDSDLKEIYEQPTFQVLARGARAAGGNAAYDSIRAVHEFLIAQETQSIGGREYLQYEPVSNIAGLGRDDNDRHVFSMNYFTYRAPA